MATGREDYVVRCPKCGGELTIPRALLRLNYYQCHRVITSFARSVHCGYMIDLEEVIVRVPSNA